MDDAVWVIEQLDTDDDSLGWFPADFEKHEANARKKAEDWNADDNPEIEYRVREYWPADDVREVLEKAKLALQAPDIFVPHIALAAIDKVLG